MTDFTSLQQKVDALKAKVEQSSITPVSLGSLLDDFILQMQSIDMTDPVANCQDALSKIDADLADVINSLESLSGIPAAVSANRSDISNLDNSLKSLMQDIQILSRMVPVECKDEDDLERKAASDVYAVGQQFYIPEE